jgi:calcium-dependent protein kinase
LDELKNGVKNICLFELLQNHHSSDNDQECYNHIMEMCDTDGDGKIDYLEFIQAAIDHKALLNKENIKIIFDMFDDNKDGKISAEELKSMFSQKSGLNSVTHGEKIITDVMNEVDLNNDGFISYEEFNQALTGLLKSNI